MTRTPSLLLPIALLCLATTAGGDDREAFSVSVRDLSSSYEELAVFAMPEETLPISVSSRAPGLHAVRAKQGALVSTGPNKWTWRAPSTPGTYELEVKALTGGGKIDLRAFVMVPASRVKAGRLNGYRIGDYPSRPLKGNPVYTPPRGFVEVTRDNADTKIAPHFRIKQFLCKQADPYPKYLLLSEKLVLKLETIGEALDPFGFDAGDIFVMSGYRTPYYNKAIGNVTFSMHQWGNAADIYLDKNKDGQMDDLNKDGRIDRSDAKTLHDIVDRLHRRADFKPFIGGLGTYAGTSAHPPFVHVDVRGWKAGW